MAVRFLVFLPFVIVSGQHPAELSDLRLPDTKLWIDNDDDFNAIHDKNSKEIKITSDWLWKLMKESKFQLPEGSGNEALSQYNGQELTEQDYDKINKVYIDKLKFKPWHNEKKLASSSSNDVLTWLDNVDKPNDHKHAIKVFWDQDMSDKHSIWNTNLGRNQHWHPNTVGDKDATSKGQTIEEIESIEDKQKLNINTNKFEQLPTTKKPINNVAIFIPNIINEESPKATKDISLQNNKKETKRPDLEDNEPVWDVKILANEVLRTQTTSMIKKAEEHLAKSLNKLTVAVGKMEKQIINKPAAHLSTSGAFMEKQAPPKPIAWSYYDN